MAVIRIPAEQDGKLAWPEKFSRSELDRMFEEMGDLRYAQQMLIHPLSLGGADLDIKWLKLFDYAKAVEGEGSLLGNPLYYWGVVPSISGKGDYLCICVIAKTSIDEYSRNNYIVDFVREKADLKRTIEIFDYTAQLYPPSSVHIEATAAQALLVQDMQMRSDLPIFSYLPKGKKEDRTKIMAQLHFGSGRTYLRGVVNPDTQILEPDITMVAFRTEWMAFPRGTHDDTLDAAESGLSAASGAGVAASLSVDPAPTIDDWTRMRNRRWGLGG